jgi:hypothetical protein
MKNLLIIAVIVLFAAQGCKEENLCLTGTGPVNNYDITTASFTNISLSGPINLRIKQGPELSVIVDAQSELFNSLSYEINSGTMEIGYKGNVTCFETDYGVWVNVTIPDIKNIETSGVSEIVSEGDLDLSYLKLDVSGTAKIELSGTADQQIIESSGEIEVKNFALLSKEVNIDVSGAADIEISCSEKLDIDVSGAADIYYKGTPNITQDSSGSLNLVDAN